MRVIFIGGMLIVVIAIYVLILIYDRRVANDKYKVLKAMWDKTKGHEVRANVLISRLELIQKVDIEYSRFSIVINKLLTDEIIKVDKKDSICFTEYGVNYYDFVLLPKHVQK